MKPFEVGDRVKCVARFESGPQMGEIYTVENSFNPGRDYGQMIELAEIPYTLEFGRRAFEADCFEPFMPS